MSKTRQLIEAQGELPEVGSLWVRHSELRTADQGRWKMPTEGGTSTVVSKVAAVVKVPQPTSEYHKRQWEASNGYMVVEQFMLWSNQGRWVRVPRWLNQEAPLSSGAEAGRVRMRPDQCADWLVDFQRLNVAAPPAVVARVERVGAFDDPTSLHKVAALIQRVQHHE